MYLGVRHVAKRRRAQHKKSKLATRALKDALDVFIYPVAVFGPLALLPQVYTLYVSQSAGSLSLPTWLILGSLNLAWLLYGAVHREWPIVLTNLVLAFLNFAVVFGILLFR